ncbi:MAG TPA: ABC transporter substrate-binding protein [Spirochaetota bacterium]|nr:ABC transporter substrate-binding protein [Spirochaetota bacterium]
MRGYILTTIFSALLLAAGATACGRGDGMSILFLHPPGVETTPVQQGLTFAVEELNSRDGLGGRTLVLETLAVSLHTNDLETLLHEQFRRSAPFLIIVQHDGIARALEAISTRIRIPVIALTELATGRTKRDAWIFSNAITAREEARIIWQLVHHFAPTGVSVIHGQTPREHEFLRELRTRAERDGRSSILNLDPGFPPEEAVILTAAATELPLVLQRLKSSGFRHPVITTSQALFPGVRRLPEAEGLLCPASAVDHRSLSLTRRTVDNFFSRFGREMTIEAALAYDSLMLVSVIAGNSPPDAESLQQALSGETVYPSIFGTRHLPHGMHSTTPVMRPVVLRKGEPEGLSFGLPGVVP